MMVVQDEEITKVIIIYCVGNMNVWIKMDIVKKKLKTIMGSIYCQPIEPRYEPRNVYFI